MGHSDLDLTVHERRPWNAGPLVSRFCPCSSVTPPRLVTFEVFMAKILKSPHNFSPQRQIYRKCACELPVRVRPSGTRKLGLPYRVCYCPPLESEAPR